LELAARIGQKLLTDKCALQKKNDCLEEQLHQANEKVVYYVSARILQSLQEINTVKPNF